MAKKKTTVKTGTVQTSKGYVTADGVEKVRVSLHLTKDQRRHLRNLAEEAGLSVTDFIIQQIGLDKGDR